VFSAQHNSKSPLLRLPAEIRNQIYDYVIGGQTYVVSKHSLGKPVYFLARKDSTGCYWREQTALSRTCRQFRYDTSVLFFQNNIFMTEYTEESPDMNGWMHSLQPYHASAIQTVFWGLWGSPEALKLLLADWMEIKRVGLYRCIRSRLGPSTQDVLKIAGYEPGDTVEDVTWFGPRLIMWYERS